MQREERIMNLEQYIDNNILHLAIEKSDEIESVSFGIDSGCGYKNDIFVSFGCRTVEGHGEKDCMCRDILDQKSLTNVEIDLKLAEQIANYVSALIGGKRVFRG